MAASVLIYSLCGLMLWILLRLIQSHSSRDTRSGIPPSTSSHDEKRKDTYFDIQPLQDFDWRTTSPIRNSPLKPKYHLTMALENISLSDIIAMDNTYSSRMQVRQSIMEDHPDATIQSTPVADEAVLELHDWMFRTYLPMRYPTIYYRRSGTDAGLLNAVSNGLIPLRASSAVEALQALGSNIDTDFLILMPRSTSPDGLPIYHLQAFVTCFPSGFSLRQKLGMPLAEIHTPVPGYKAKLEKSMDRFFARLQCGKAVKRSNWGITTVTDLFLEGGTHFHNDKASDGPSSTSTQGNGASARVPDAIERQKREVIVENCRLRSERQTLFRLPQSKAIVFSFKTYQYRLEDVKNDGYADELAAAIEGLAMGSVPEMNFYKRGVVWSEAVLQYLRS